MKLLLIQGANMEYLGRRQPELYGTTTARELDAILRRQARSLDVALEIFYTNTEGAAVIAIHMTNIEKRGYGSVTSEAAIGMIAGFGVDSYVLALEAMVARLRQQDKK